MAESVRSGLAAVGFRVKSGWATAVLVAGPPDVPRVIVRQRVELSDPEIPASSQPYHARMGTLQTDEGKLQQLRAVVAEAARHSVRELIGGYRSTGHQVLLAGMVVGSDTDPARITNPHIRAHALEGRLFRTVLEDALKSCGLGVTPFVERNLYAKAVEVLQLPESELKLRLGNLGRGIGGPWRIDEKAACLAAWLVLD